jgi:hypothetical protein
MPLDVVKTRLMTQSGTGQYKGLLDCLLTIAKDEELPALFIGVVPRVIIVLLSRALLVAAMVAAGDDEVPTTLLELLDYLSVA